MCLFSRAACPTHECPEYVSTVAFACFCFCAGFSCLLLKRTLVFISVCVCVHSFAFVCGCVFVLAWTGCVGQKVILGSSVLPQANFESTFGVRCGIVCALHVVTV